MRFLTSFSNRTNRANIDEKVELPSLTALVPAYNEEDVISARIDNLLEQNYPRDRYQILIASDCSTDRTDEIVKAYRDENVELVRMERRRGKLGIIDQVVPQAKGEVVVITDANVEFAEDALLKLSRNYSDPEVGAVSGYQICTTPEKGAVIENEQSYRNSERKVKSYLSKLGMVIGVFGGFYSVRRKLFIPIGAKLGHDDIIAPVEILAQGYKVLFDETAVAKEEISDDAGLEFKRRIRLSAFNLKTMPRLLNRSWKAGIQPFIVSIIYKTLRWLNPFFFAAILLTSLFLYETHVIYKSVVFLFILAILLALAGWIADKFKWRAFAVTAMFHFAFVNVAGILGFFKLFQGVKPWWNPRG